MIEFTLKMPGNGAALQIEKSDYDHHPFQLKGGFFNNNQIPPNVYGWMFYTAGNYIFNYIENNRFSFNQTGLLKKSEKKDDEKYFEDSTNGYFGIFKSEDADWCLFVPTFGVATEDTDKKLNLKGLINSILNLVNKPKSYQIAPLIFVTKLDDKNPSAETKWILFADFWFTLDHFNSGVGFDTLLDSIFKPLGLAEGNDFYKTFFNATPFSCFPQISEDKNNNSSVIFAFDYQSGKSSNLRTILQLDQKESFGINFFLNRNGTHSLDFENSKITIPEPYTSKTEQKPIRDKSAINNHADKAELGNSPPFTPDFVNYIISNANKIFDTKSSQSFDAEINIELVVPNKFSFNFGSMSFAQDPSFAKDPQKNEAQANLNIKLKGTWNSEVFEVFPEIDLTNFPCTYQYSSGTDLASLDLFTVFDSFNEEEEQLHRESQPVIKPYEENLQNVGELRIRVKTELGRNGIVQWELKSKRDKNNQLPQKNKSFYFQAKPFTVARTWEPDHDDESGEALAFWTSNDPEGPQWRVADATMTIEFPPQAVGEEMERGKRFWPESHPDKSYIDPDHPIKYRFSPTTLLEVRPSIKDRRYNPVPNNLQKVFKEAVVTKFVTEIVYPVRTEFNVDDEGFPHIRIAELSSFIGKPAVNLPVYPSNFSTSLDIQSVEGLQESNTVEILLDSLILFLARPIDSNKKKKILEDISKIREFREQSLYFPKTILAEELANWKVGQSINAKLIEDTGNYQLNYEPINFINPYIELRSRQSAVKANFVSRLAEYHLYDPYRQDGKLGLKDRLKFTIRSKSEGAPPLISPLPTAIKLLEDSLTQINDFLYKDEKTSKPIFVDDDNQLGALRAGVIHTIEFASELLAVLRNPTSTTGLIDSLSFSALGASGHISVSFDEGRTTFVADVYHGQIGRLQKIRIGRLGVLWNKVRHVIVYERTTVPSQQFEDEQNSPAFLGWPIIRKTAEYIEPIEQIRKFSAESDGDQNATGFVEACEILTPRIYVNGVWGKNYEHGYEIPLWNRNDNSGFYPKPCLTLRAHAGADQVSRQVLEEPENLYFYTNTEPGKGNDPDKWNAQVEVDCPYGPARLPVITGSDIRGNSSEILLRPAMPEPSLGATRRPRYDLAVSSSGPVNLQHGRGSSEMLAAMNVLSLARTAESKAVNLDSITQLLEVNKCIDQLNEIEFKSEFESLIRQYKDKLPHYFRSEDNPCQTLASDLRTDINQYFERIKKQLSTKLSDVEADNPAKRLSKNISNNNSLLAEHFKFALPNPKSQLLLCIKVIHSQLEELKSTVTNNSDKDLINIQLNIQAAFEPFYKLLHYPILALDNNDFDKFAKYLTEAPSGQQRTPFETDANNLITKLNGIQTFNASELEDVRIKIKNILNAIKELNGSNLPFVLLLQSRLINALEKLEQITSSSFETAWKNKLSDVKGSSIEIISAVINFANNDNVKKILIGLKNDSSKLSQSIKSLETNSKELINGKFQSIENLNSDFDGLYKFVDDELNLAAGSLIGIVDNYYNSLTSNVTSFQESSNKELIEFSSFLLTKITHLEFLALNLADNWFDSLKTTVDDSVNNLETICNGGNHEVNQLFNQLRNVGENLSNDLEGRIHKYLSSIANEASQREVSKVAEDIKNQAGKGLKLVKAIGDLPSLPTLTFNANRAEYVFEDLQNQIETSPFAAKLREVDSAMKELGLAVPAQALLNQVVPNTLKNLDFNKVFKNLGGIDFSNIFPNFKLPEISPKNLQITHGVNEKTQHAWAKADVNVDFPEKQDMFKIMGLGVTASNMKLVAHSEVDSSGEKKSTTIGKFTSDMAMEFSGNTMATFREVTVSFNGGKFDVDISPDKVDLHPCIQFISEIAKKLEGKLPPAIQLIKDDKGIPIGAKSCITTMVTAPPPLGPISLGTLFLQSGINLMMGKNGFVVSSFLSVGSKEAPIFLQIGFLGGGIWLVVTATQHGPSTDISASLGMAVGSTRSLSLSGVATGTYSILLFAYATYEMVNSSPLGLEFRAGLIMQGSARILGLANASVYLLLEVIHGSNGDTRGHGILDVSVDICWCYTLHVRQQVEQKL